MQSVLIRADASSEIGIGHIMRCLALASALIKMGATVTFLSNCQNEALRDRILNCGASFTELRFSHPDPADLNTTLDALAQLSESQSERSSDASDSENGVWVVLDGYHFDSAFQRSIRQSGHRLLVVDDNAKLPSYHADILLNQNILADQLEYNLDGDTCPLLGSSYALLRPEFQADIQTSKGVSQVANKILITMGGSDFDNVSLTAMDGADQAGIQDMQVKVIAGPANTHIESLRKAATASVHSVTVEQGSDVDIFANMSWADVAIGAAGSTCWEMARMGLPGLLIVVADNQLDIAYGLHEADVAINLGRHTDVTADQIAAELSLLCRGTERRALMSSNGMQLIDGKGADRVATIMKGLSFSIAHSALSTRRADEADALSLWRMANDPAVRVSAFNKDYIPWNDHIKWLMRKLSSRKSLIFVSELADSVVSQARYDVISNKTAEIDYSVASSFRSKGLGYQILNTTLNEAFESLDIDTIVGKVLEGNTPSIRVFERLGFSLITKEQHNDDDVLTFELKSSA